MESLPTKAAAKRLGVSVQKVHRLTASHHINPVFKASGRTGEKFWNPADIERLAEILAEGDAA